MSRQKHALCLSVHVAVQWRENSKDLVVQWWPAGRRTAVRRLRQASARADCLAHEGFLSWGGQTLHAWPQRGRWVVCCRLPSPDCLLMPFPAIQGAEHEMLMLRRDHADLCTAELAACSRQYQMGRLQ